MNLIKSLGLSSISAVSLFFATTGLAQADTVIRYEIPGGDASYLNICAPKYKDGWGKVRSS